ncbi:hypothetical protein Tco_1299976, partial [Tanacetum coccineum]
MPTSRESLNAAAIKQLITQCVTEAMAAYEANQNNQNGDGSPHVNAGGVVPVAREYSYQDFMKFQPLNFKGTEGVVGLTRWFENIETVFHTSNYPQKCQVKYASCTLQDSALTWWNSHKRTIRTDAAYAMTWKALMKLMTEMWKLQEGWPPSKRLLGLYYDDMLWMWKKRTHQEVLPIIGEPKWRRRSSSQPQHCHG